MWFSHIVVRDCVCMGGCRCMCIASFSLIRSFTAWTQDAFVAGQEGPGARGPRSPSSNTFQTPGVSIDSMPVRILRTRSQDPYQNYQKEIGDKCLKSYKKT